jgi:U3 small nucleolar RNA-associated protein 10
MPFFLFSSPGTYRCVYIGFNRKRLADYFFKVQGGALDLLSERLHDVASGTRQKMTARINETVEAIRKLLVLHPDGPLAASGYKALQAIASTMASGEESSLTTLVPLILTAIRGRKMAASAVAALAPLSFVSLSI